VHRERVDVAEPAVLEIARGGVMECVRLLPVVVGVSVSTPRIEPTMSAARVDRKNAAWPQSCWMMNRRIRKKAAGTARSRVSQ